MPRIVTVVLLSFYAAVLPIQAIAGPVVFCEVRTFDAGVRDHREELVHDFVLRNSGDGELTITNVRACCGARARAASTRIPPGGETSVAVTMPLKGKRGPVSKTIWVHSNDPATPILELMLNCTVVVPVEVVPQVLEFGMLPKDSTVHRTAMVACQPDSPLKITGATVDSDRLSVRIESASPFSHRIIVATVPPLPRTGLSATVTLTTDSADRDYRKIEIPVRIASGADLTVLPTELSLLEAVGQARPLSRSIVVRSRTGAPFAVGAVDLPDASIGVEVSPLASGGSRVVLSNLLPAPGLDGKAVTLHTDSPDTPVLTIPIRVLPRAMPERTAD